MPSAPACRTAASDLPVPFAQEDLARLFEPATVRKGRALILADSVSVIAVEGRIEASVAEPGRELRVSIIPMRRARRLRFDRVCSCGASACAHMAAAAMLVLDTRPEWRRPVQTSLLDLMDPAPEAGTPEHGETAAAAWSEIPGRSPAPVPGLLARWQLEAGRDDVALFGFGAQISWWAESGLLFG